MKKALLLVFLAVPAFSDQIAVSQFRGINANESSVIIDPSYAQDALNVEITPGGKSVKKRSGYGLYKKLYGTQLNNVHGGWHFFDGTGNDVQVWASSTSVYGIVADGTPTQLVSSATLNSTLDCVDIQGSAYCATSSRDFLLQTNGTTKTWYTTALGTMVEATPDRLVVSGVANNLSTLYVSGSNSYTTYTVGPLPTDPFTEVIAANGSKLTHTRWACGKLLWWKDQSFGYFTFEDQYTGEVKIISDTIGTFDNASAVDPGGSVWFRGQDGHIWQYNCSGLIKESIEITPFVQGSGRRTENSWTQTTQSDFQSGFSVNLDSTTNPGSLNLIRFNDSFSSLGNWTPTSGVWTVASGVVRSSGGIIVTASSITLTDTFIVSAQVKLEGPSNTAWVGAVTISTTGVIAEVQNNGAGAFVVCIGAFDGTTFGSFTTCVNGGTPDTNYHWITISRVNSSGGYRLYWDGVYVSSITSVAYGTTFIRGFMAVSGGYTQYNNFMNFNMSASTGTYYSAWKNAANFSSWSIFNPTYSNDLGSNSFYVRASTSPQSVTNSTVAWVSQTPGTLVVLSTPGIYFQVRDDFSIGLTSSAINNPALNSFSVNWFEGTATDQAYMLYFDNAIWVSVAYGVGVSSNTYIFRRDLINDGWVVYNFGAGGMLVQTNRLFLGDVSANANIFQYGSGTSDSGTATTAYWKSKDFTGSDPFLQNQYTQIDTLVRQNTNQSLTATYKLDTSTTSTSYTINLSSTSQSIINNRKQLPAGKSGYLFNIQYGDATTTSAWEILGFRFGFVPQSYRPSQ